MAKIKAEPPEPPKVDRTQRILTNGEPVPADQSHTEIDPDTKQQKSYVILTPEERMKGYVRPVRRTYRHVGREQQLVDDQGQDSHKVLIRGCGKLTTMSRDIAETYARDPEFYTGTFCVTCGAHYPLDEFVWEGTDQKVGS